MTPMRILVPLLLAAPALAQTTWFVDASATPPGNGTPGSPYTSIQFALEQPTTVGGDTLSIAPGIYTEHVEAFGKDVDLFAPGGPQVTVLNGGLQISAQIGGPLTVTGLGFQDENVLLTQADVVLQGCWLTSIGNQATSASLVSFSSTLTLEDCIVANNPSGGLSLLQGTATVRDTTFANNGPYGHSITSQAYALLVEDCLFDGNDVLDGSGGALQLSGQEATVRRCTFSDNSAYLTGRRGGAIVQWFGTTLVEECTFQGNASDQGGAIALGPNAAMQVVDSTFTANLAVRDGTGMIPGQGGAIHVALGGELEVEGSLFQINSAPASGFGTGPGDQLGGAVYADGSGSVLRRCTFTDNNASLGGAVLYGPAELERCVLLQNVNGTSGGTVEGGALLDRCTLVHNTPAPGGAAVLGSTLESSIVWDNAVAQLGGGASATWSCIQGGAAGVGNIAADPLFIDLANEQVGLLMGSPCIDTGAPSAPVDPDLTPADMGGLPFTWQPIGASYCSSNPNSSGQTAVMAVLGSTLVADDFVRAQATQTAKNQIGLFLISQNQGFVPLFGGSQGNLCLGSPIFRVVGLPDSVGVSGELGLLNARLQLTSPPYGPSVLPGQTWNVQAWFRDVVAGQNTSNTSDAVSVTFQ